MQGYVLTSNLEKRVGDMYWYDKDGFDASYRKYYNPTNHKLTYYHNNGVIWKKIYYNKSVKDGEVKIFNENGVLVTSETFKDGFIVNNTKKEFKEKNAHNKNSKTKNGLTTVLNSIVYAKDTKTKIIHIKDIDSIGVSYQGYVSFYAKGGENHYFQNDKFYQKKKLENSLDILIESEISKIKINEIKEQSVERFMDDVKSREWSHVFNISVKNKIICKQFSPSVFCFIGLRLKKNKEQEKEDSYKDNVEEWNVYDVEFYEMNTIMINGNKPILLLKKDGYVRYYIIPTIKDGLIVKFSEKGVVEQLKYALDKSILEQVMFIGKTADFYRVNPLGGKKYVTNKYNEILIDKPYSSIELKNQYIIARDKENIDIYDLRLDKKNINIHDLNFNKTKAASDDEKLDEIPKSNLKEEEVNQILLEGRVTRFYKIKSVNGKKYIANKDNEKVIDIPYNKIELKNQYIIARDKENIDIYNLKLDKLPLNIRAYHFDGINLQVLDGNTVKYIDESGKETEWKKGQLRMVCGTVDHILFELKKDKVNAVEVHLIRAMRRGESFSKTLFLKNLDKKYDITFLNGKKGYSYSDNSKDVDGYITETARLIVSKNKKKGLYYYDYKKLKSKYKGNTSAVKILPIIYDDITYKGGLFLLKKKMHTEFTV